MTENLRTFTTFLGLLEQFSTDMDEYRKLLHPEWLQTEYPNLLTTHGQVRDIDNGFKGIELSSTILSSHKYEITNIVEHGDNLVIETVWTGTMAIDAGDLKKGQQLKAFICMVVEFKDGLIYRQKNYDCYEPFDKPE